jgi:FtsZ-binding cell division protein ZapB
MDYIGDRSLLGKKGESVVNKTGKIIDESLVTAEHNEDKDKNLRNFGNLALEKEKSSGMSENLCQEDGFLPGSTETDNPDTDFQKDPRPKLNSTLDLLFGYRSLMESYNLLSQSFSKHVSLTQTPHLLDQMRELRAENEKFKQEKLHLQHTIQSLLVENSHLKDPHNSQPCPSKHTTVESLSKPSPPSFFQEVFERQSHELAALRSQVGDLGVFRDQFVKIEKEQSQVADQLKILLTDKDLAQKEIQSLNEKVKKTEDLLEVVKIHRDLLDKKVNQMKIIGEDLQNEQFEGIEKRVSLLEQRLKGTEDVEKYIQKHKKALETLKTSENKLKYLQIELEETKAKNKQLEQYIKTAANEKPSPKVLAKLVHLLHSSTRHL